MTIGRLKKLIAKMDDKMKVRVACQGYISTVVRVEKSPKPGVMFIKDDCGIDINQWK